MIKKQWRYFFILSLAALFLYRVAPALADGNTYYVATSGVDDSSADGSAAAPWATITYALTQVPDNSTILVRPGTYNGRVRLRGTFLQGVTVKSEIPYQAQLRYNGTVVTCFYGQGITLESFDIAHSGTNPGGLVVQIQDLIGPAGGSDYVSRIILRNNIFHDSNNNDILKINHGAGQITVEGNMFYNQEGSDEHIDVNSVTDVVIQDNVFFNDFAGSGRFDTDTSSYIVIKDSDGDSDTNLGSENITVRRNVFLHWEGSNGQGFVRAGEDGTANYEARNVLIENNLMIGDNSHQIRSPFQVMGAYSVTIRANTVTGNMPAKEFGARIFTYGANPNNNQIHLHNNIWSDPAGTMGDTFNRGNNTNNLTFDNNLFWNGGNNFPTSSESIIEVLDDVNRVVGNPLLGDLSGLTLPRWNPGTSQFADGSTTIRQVFEKLVMNYGVPATGSPAIDAADLTNAPTEDILGRPRPAGMAPDIGVFEVRPLGAIAGNQQIRLIWEANTPLLPLDTWRIEYTGPSGNQASPITNIISTTRVFTLTGLTNYVPYTISLTLMRGGISVAGYGEITTTPTDRFVYLPIIQKP